jgi:serine/threonine-protein kinase
MAAPALPPGTLLSGRYQIIEAIGDSDLSLVYAASDTRGQAQVALKVFDRAVLSRSAALSEYQALARQASGLGVEGIARAYDFGIDANSGLPFSTAERIGWASLDRRVLMKGPVAITDLSRAFSVLARALDAAHTAGLFHRDLKPQNVFISPDNPEWVRLTDFGMTAVRRGAPEAMGWGGPPGYTAPEVVDAAAPGSVPADLFALGVIAFFALTRSTPFRSLRNPGFDPNAHWAELNHALHPLSARAREIGVALDPVLDPWFSRALALKADERFPSAGEMARELAALADRAGARGLGGTHVMPGIAAAIAQPLVFQPDPSPPASGPSTAAAAAPVSADAVPIEPPPSSHATPLAGRPNKSSGLPLLIGFGVLLLSGVAVGGYLLLGGEPTTATTQPSADNSAAPPPAAPVPVPVTATATTATATAVPSAAPAVELAPLPAKAQPAIAKPAAAAPAAKPTAAAPAAKPVAAARARPTAATPAPKPAPAAPAVKPAVKPAAKPAAAAPTSKKKCSTFLGCK